MPEIETVTIQIGRYRVTTHPKTAKQIVSDPARLLLLYEMMLEAAHHLPLSEWKRPGQ